VTEPSSEERARLITAAWTVVRRSGFDGIKVQLVLKEAGLSARTFYRHFSDKDSLLIALVEDEYGAASRRLRQAVADAPDEPAAQVAAWIREMLLAADDPARAPRTRLFSSYHLLMGRFPGLLVRSTQMILDPLEDSIRQGQDEGVFGGDDAHQDAQQVARLAAGALTEYLAGANDSAGIEALIDSTVRFALRALEAYGTRRIGSSVNRFNK
jgi:TetR/AcrR family transcriptional regulator